tara:strand:- start:436 stop:777 length:342 start_codon:yes stop_codon:yes gene_type:complete
MEGTVNWFNIKKGYGFIKGEDGNDYFVHFTAVPKGVFLKENDKVSFEPAKTERGEQAQNVKFLGEGSAPQEEEHNEETQEESQEQTEEEPVEEEPQEEPVEEQTEEESQEEQK